MDSLYPAPVHALDVPCSHHIPPCSDFLPSLAGIASSRLFPPRRHRELLSEPLPVTDPCRSRAAAGQWSPFSAVWGWISAGMGPSPAPSTSFCYLCWPPAQSGDEWVDQVLSFINLRMDFSQYTSVVGSIQPPNACMCAWCLPMHLSSLPCPGYWAKKDTADEGNEGVQGGLLVGAGCVIPLRDKSRQQGF